jgi:ParB-like chromosome segregation protein Spo0J
MVMNTDFALKKGGETSLPLVEISFSKVNLLDLTHVITFAPDLAPLKRSIARAGILHPLILQKICESGRYRIVSGYKRLKVLESLGGEKVMAYISTSKEDLQLFLLGLEENLGTRLLNTVEKSLVLSKLVRQFGLSREAILQEHLPSLGLGSDPKTLDLYLSISDWSDEIKNALASDRISLALAQQLAALCSEDRRAFSWLIEELRLGKSLQREFLALLLDLAAKEKTSLSSLLEDEQLVPLINDPVVQASIRAQRVREALIRRRYPTLAQATERFEELKKRLKLPPHMSLKTSPFFEGEDWQFSVTFRNREELEAARKALQRLAEDPFFNQLLHFHLP